MNYIRRRKLRKMRRKVIKIVGAAIVGWSFASLAWNQFDRRLAYKECYVYGKENCDRVEGE